jgi:hypothetical protein
LIRPVARPGRHHHKRHNIVTIRRHGDGDFQLREAAMDRWKMAGVEPSLDELLDDEVMVPVMRSAGLRAEDLRALVIETAARLGSDLDDLNPRTMG